MHALSVYICILKMTEREVMALVASGCIRDMCMWTDCVCWLTQRLLNDGSAESMDAICLKAAAENVHRLTKRLASRMGFDKDTNRIETAERKKEKLKQAQGLSRNFAKVSHSNPIIVAEYLVSYVSFLIPPPIVYLSISTEC